MRKRNPSFSWHRDAYDSDIHWQPAAVKRAAKFEHIANISLNENRSEEFLSSQITPFLLFISACLLSIVSCSEKKKGMKEKRNKNHSSQFPGDFVNCCCNVCFCIEIRSLAPVFVCRKEGWGRKEVSFGFYRQNPKEWAIHRFGQDEESSTVCDFHSILSMTNLWVMERVISFLESENEQKRRKNRRLRENPVEHRFGTKRSREYWWEMNWTVNPLLLCSVCCRGVSEQQNIPCSVLLLCSRWGDANVIASEEGRSLMFLPNDEGEQRGKRAWKQTDTRSKELKEKRGSGWSDGPVRIPSFSWPEWDAGKALQTSNCEHHHSLLAFSLKAHMSIALFSSSSFTAYPSFLFQSSDVVDALFSLFPSASDLHYSRSSFWFILL